MLPSTKHFLFFAGEETSAEQFGSLVQGHIVLKWQRLDFNPGPADDSRFLEDFSIFTKDLFFLG